VSAPSFPGDAGQMIAGSSASTVYPLTAPVSFQVLYISDNSNDSIAGTGLRTVLIEGLKGDYSAYSEIVQLNGTTPVNLVEPLIHVNKIIPLSAGSNGQVAGMASVRRSTDNQIYANANNGANDNGFFMCPLGYKAILNHLHVTSGATCAISIRVFRRGRTMFESIFRIDSIDRSFMLENSPTVMLEYGDALSLFNISTQSCRGTMGFLLIADS
jgi:hypothetical protein